MHHIPIHNWLILHQRPAPHAGRAERASVTEPTEPRNIVRGKVPLTNSRSAERDAAELEELGHFVSWPRPQLFAAVRQAETKKQKERNLKQWREQGMKEENFKTSYSSFEVFGSILHLGQLTTTCGETQ